MKLAGAPETIRTSGLCLRRATLYPAELRVRGVTMYATHAASASRGAGRRGGPSGGFWEIRLGPEPVQLTEEEICQVLDRIELGIGGHYRRDSFRQGIGKLF